MNVWTRLRKFPLWSWIWFILGVLYFILPLLATFEFSLGMERDMIGFKAYESAFADKEFWQTFGYSVFLALMTIIMSIILIVPTAYWIRLRLPEARRLVEFITLLPFVIPAIILVFGLIRIYSSPVNIPFTEVAIGQPLTNFKFGHKYLDHWRIYGVGVAVHVSLCGYRHAHGRCANVDGSRTEPRGELVHHHRPRHPAERSDGLAKRSLADLCYCGR